MCFSSFIIIFLSNKFHHNVVFWTYININSIMLMFFLQQKIVSVAYAIWLSKIYTSSSCLLQDLINSDWHINSFVDFPLSHSPFTVKTGYRFGDRRNKKLLKNPAIKRGKQKMKNIKHNLLANFTLKHKDFDLFFYN